ncbi:MAG: FMN-binding glutamate synthase family protein, partial [Pseudomonadota bacterium]
MPIRYLPFALVATATAAGALTLIFFDDWSPVLGWLTLFGAGLTVLGLRDLAQDQHAVLRNYPLTGHLRYLLEGIRPEIRQYFFESDKDGTPFSRDQRAIVYQRAKEVKDKRPFGTQFDVYEDGFEWMHHSIAAKSPEGEPPRVEIGGADCKQRYNASLLNISAMSYGSLSPTAVRALNRGAAIGGFAHDTGEGGISDHHRRHNGDLIWEIGTGYFGCRTKDGAFDAAQFTDVAQDEQVKMVELKLSQGAKPGHGGILPSAKITPEIAEIRGIPEGADCVSPPAHSAFATPIEMMEFISELREKSGGKPTGFKLCIGHPWEFLAICKAMIETDITPDFIVVDGSEGGTGAAPLEFLDNVGMPLREGLLFVANALVGAGLRDRVRIGASGKVTTGFDIARALAVGADWCNAARGFMFAVGCIQAQACHTGRCPTGVTSMDPSRYRGIKVVDKAERVANFHRETLRSLSEMVAAAGLDDPSELRPEHFRR